jgi:hypothetical protein
LDDVDIDPGPLDLLAVRGFSDRFDRRDLLAGEIGDRQDAGAQCPAVDMHGAGAALRNAAAEFCPGQPDDVAQDPQQWHVVRDADFICLPVDSQARHRSTPSTRD